MWICQWSGDLLLFWRCCGWRQERTFTSIHASNPCLRGNRVGGPAGK
jgi:hypothetical protein